MAKQNVYTYATQPAFDDAGPSSHRGLIYVLIGVVVVAFGGFIWNSYGVRPPPRIEAPEGPYRVAPEAGAGVAPAAEENALYESLDGTGASPAAQTPAQATPRAEAPLDTPAVQQAGPPTLGAPPVFASHGPYVAQVAALQSEQAISAAWQRLATRAPDLFSSAHMDVERADLGQRGIYFRIRAGYFADRSNAVRFCDRIRQLGQDCIVVSR